MSRVPDFSVPFPDEPYQPPPPGGVFAPEPIVAMCMAGNHLCVATGRGVYMLDDRYILRRLVFADGTNP